MNPISSAQFGMFQRRLVLLSIGLVLVLAGLTVQLVRLSVLEHPDRLKKARGRVSEAEFLPTLRGCIVDRRGRVLVEDAPSYDIAIHWDAITGAWPRQQATAEQVQAAGGRRAWLRLPREERDRRIALATPAWNQAWSEVLDAVTKLGGMSAAARDAAIAGIVERVESIQQQKDARDLAKRVDLYGEEARADFRSEKV